MDLIKEESSTKKHRSGSRSSLERKEQKRKARDMMKLDKGSDLAKDELREKRKIRKDFLQDILENELKEQAEIKKLQKKEKKKKREKAEKERHIERKLDRIAESYERKKLVEKEKS